MQKLLRRLRNLILDLLFPLECLNCREEGDYLCENCFQKLKNQAPTAFKENSSCLRSANLKISHLEKIYIAGDFESSILNNLIIKYKYNFISALGKPLARFLIEFWQEKVMSRIAKQEKTTDTKTSSLLIIPIPLAKKRLNWRGFNQAEIIAREFSEKFNYELNLDLKRIKHKKAQATLNEAERLENIKSVFIWTGKNLANQKIILVDDVTTTGATLNEAARVLKEAGSKKIYGLVLAKG